MHTSFTSVTPPFFDAKLVVNTDLWLLLFTEHLAADQK